MAGLNSEKAGETQPLLIVISGPSGAGKDAVIRQMKRRMLPFSFVVTTTTRPPRHKEVHGVDYHFVSKPEFLAMIAQNELLEYALVYGDYKGVPRSQVQQALDKGLDVVLRLDVQGAARIKQLYPDVVSIFLTAQTEEELFSRLTKRKSESEQSLNTRRQTVCEELSRINEFDYVVINRDRRLGKTVNDIAAIIQAEHLRVRHRKVSL